MGFWEGWHCAFGQASVYDIVSWADGIALIKNDAQISIQFRFFHSPVLGVYALLLRFSISSRYPGGTTPRNGEAAFGLLGLGRGGLQFRGQVRRAQSPQVQAADIGLRFLQYGMESWEPTANADLLWVRPACPWHKEALSQTLFHAISVQFTQRSLFKPSISSGGSSSRQETRQVTRIPAWLA